MGVVGFRGGRMGMGGLGAGLCVFGSAHSRRGGCVMRIFLDGRPTCRNAEANSRRWPPFLDRGRPVAKFERAEITRQISERAPRN